MNILVIIGEVAYISRNETLKGMVEGARRDRNNIFLFTCEGFLFHSLKGYSRGEYEIFRLPDISRYDGVIVDFNSFQNEEVRKYLKGKIEEAGVPCVAFEYPVTGSCKVSFESKDIFGDMIDHIVKDHGRRRTFYISGPEHDVHSQLRRDIFLEKMKENGIEVTEDMVRYSNYNLGGGRRTMESYLSEHELPPEAVIAANDFMAIGAIEALEKYGYTVPEDCMVGGIDCSELGQKMSPRLTTVNTCVYEAGKEAYNTLIRIIKTGENPGEIVIRGRVVKGRTCGCGEDHTAKERHREYVKLSIQMNTSLDLIKELSIHLAEVKTLVEFERALTRLISKIGIDYFYYCQCGSRESYYQELENIAHGSEADRDIKQYADTVWCPIAYEKGGWASYPAYETKDLLPPQHKESDNGIYYIVMPVHRDEECLGYVVMGDFNGLLSGKVLQHLVLALDRAIGNIRENDIFRTMLAEINAKWQFDELTSLYNRSGLFHQISTLIAKSEKENKGIAVRFFDLDGLKEINDVRGHKAGDGYLVKMARLLQDVARDMTDFSVGDNVLAVRYGGDEFLLVSIAESEEIMKEQDRSLDQYINDTVSASMGSAFSAKSSMTSFKKLIETADHEMYANKILRKKAR